MEKEFQKLYDIFKNNNDTVIQLEYNKNQRNYIVESSLKNIIFDNIGEETFSSIMDMKYSFVSKHHSGRLSGEFCSFHNKFWDLSFTIIVWNPHLAPLGFNIALKKVGTYYSWIPDENTKILSEWLVYFKEQCRLGGIIIKD
ncbi:MAG: hypothetical protein ACFFAS_12640 [Promethearchaeota archaeon]